MGEPGGEEDDHLVRAGRCDDDDDDLDDEEEEEDPEEEELEEDPEEVELEEVAADEETEEEEDEDVRDDEEVDEIEEEEEDELEEFEEEEADELEEVEVEAENNEVAGEDKYDVDDDKPSSPPIAPETDATVADRLRDERQIGLKTDTDGPDDETEDTKDTKPPIFTKAEPLKDEHVDCAFKGEGIFEMESDYGKKETSQHFNEKNAKDIDLYAVRGEARGVESAEPLSSNPSISVGPGAVKYDKVDCGSEGDGAKVTESDGEREICHLTNKKYAEDIDVCAQNSEPRGFEAAQFLSINPPISVKAESISNEKSDLASEVEGVKRMESDCEEKERCISKKGTESIDICAPSSVSMGNAEITKPRSTMGLDSELLLMQEGGVEDMELDSDENIVHGSDVDGIVVDSTQENIALNRHDQVSCNTGADGSNNKTVVSGSLKSSSSGGKDTIHSCELKLGEDKNLNLDLKEHTTPKRSSVADTTGKQRSLLPVSQLIDRNKRPAIMCSYYAKGWCIKGNSCRFLHAKENKDITNNQQGRDLASANGENQIGEGVGDSAKTIFPEQHAESHIWQLNNKLGYSSLESRLLHSAKPEFESLVASSSAFASRLKPSNVNTTEAVYRQSRHMFNDPLQSIANRYINQHPLAATDMYSSRYISPINGSSNSIISLNSNPYDAHKILPGSIDFNASSSSLGLRAQRDRLNSLGLALKEGMYKWEPSKPFRPSYYFSISSGSSPGSMYDPLRDSIEHTSLMGIGSFRADPIHYPSHQKYPDSASEGNHFEMDGYNGAALDRYGHSRVTGLPDTEAEVAESSVADQGYLGSPPGEDKGSGTSQDKDLSGTNKTNTVSAEKKSKLIEENIHISGMNVGRGLAEDNQRESRTFRQFRVALIEFVKELLKPAWRVGNLGKDAHNLIVKKTVKKVLSSLQSHQVPSSLESVQQYLSASQPKITILLEAYVQKHNKT